MCCPTSHVHFCDFEPPDRVHSYVVHGHRRAGGYLASALSQTPYKLIYIPLCHANSYTKHHNDQFHSNSYTKRGATHIPSDTAVVILIPLYTIPDTHYHVHSD